MASVSEDIAPLVAGDKLTREEFLRRWEAMPELKRAELIGGIVYIPSDPLTVVGENGRAVYMPSPLSMEHADRDFELGHWVGHYVLHTPGCKAGHAATWLMLEDAPQPDINLRILPEYGGQSRVHGLFGKGAPELATEVSLSSTSHDLHQKLELYQEAGVQEYLCALLREKEVRWHQLVDGAYQLLPCSGNGIIRSIQFPGLWLNVPAFLAGDMAQVLRTLDEGLRTPEHAQFVARLAAKRS